jgi:uncharacterized membrane protein
MKDVAAWSLALSMGLIGICVHLVARPWSARRVFFVDVGRERNDQDAGRIRRVLVFNGTVTAIGIALSFLGSGSVAAVLLVSLVLPFLPITYLLVEIVRLTKSLPKTVEPSRFSVPLADPPPMSRYMSPALQLAHGALIAGSAAAFVWLLEQLPARVAMHWNMHGQVDRWGNPAELWFWVGILAFDWALCWAVAWGVAKERWALPTEGAERYAELQLERRSAIVRLVELLVLLINGSMVVLWLGLAYGSIPGNEHIRGPALVFGIVLMVVGSLVPLALFLPRMVKLQEELRAIAGSDVLGTHAGGWRAGGLIYYAPEDPAVFVPKKVGIGQTLNFGRPGAWAFIAVITVLPLVIALGAIWLAQ